MRSTMGNAVHAPACFLFRETALVVINLHLLFLFLSFGDKGEKRHYGSAFTDQPVDCGIRNAQIQSVPLK